MCPRGRAVCACGIQRAARIGMVLMLKGRYLPPGLVLSQQLPTGLLRLQQGWSRSNWGLTIGSLKLELEVAPVACECVPEITVHACVCTYARDPARYAPCCVHGPGWCMRFEPSPLAVTLLPSVRSRRLPHAVLSLRTENGRYSTAE
jgi:hypothetical protein